MTITLEEGMEAFVEQQLQAGLYTTPDEAINSLLKERLAQDDAENEEFKTSLRTAMAEEPVGGFVSIFWEGPSTRTSSTTGPTTKS